jgi:Spy/CpxP family protein refolding chaperone
MKINCIKKTTILLVVLTLCAVASAEPVPSPDSNSPVCKDKRPDARQHTHWFMQELSEKLNLTDAQKTAIELIVADEANKIKEIRENSRKQIDATLTPEQQKEFAEIRSEARHRMREHAGDRLKMLAEKLNLTDAQTAAIKPIFATEANDIKAVWQDNSLPKEQKQGKMLDIRKAANEKISTILTPEQQAKWAELKDAAGQMRHKGMRPGPGHKPWEQPPPPPPSEKQEPADSNS